MTPVDISFYSIALQQGFLMLSETPDKCKLKSPKIKIVTNYQFGSGFKEPLKHLLLVIKGAQKPQRLSFWDHSSLCTDTRRYKRPNKV